MRRSLRRIGSAARSRADLLRKVRQDLGLDEPPHAKGGITKQFHRSAPEARTRPRANAGGLPTWDSHTEAYEEVLAWEKSL